MIPTINKILYATDLSDNSAVTQLSWEHMEKTLSGMHF
jgi:hypothetical protein